MCEHSELTLAFPRRLRAPVQRRTQSPLMTRKGALRLPTLPVLPFGKMAFHLPAVLGLGPLAPLAASVNRDDGAAHAQLFAADTMMLFAVEGGIAEDTIPAHNERGLVESRDKLRGIVTRAGADGGRRKEMTAGITDDGEFGPQPGAVLFARTLEEIGGGVLTLQPGSVNRRLGPIVDQATVLGAHGRLDEEENDLPFFSSRCSALQRVE